METRFVDKNIKELLNEARYNKNTVGKPLSVTSGTINEEKRSDGALFIFNVMYGLGHYAKAKNEVENHIEIIPKMISNAREIVEDRGIKL